MVSLPSLQNFDQQRWFDLLRMYMANGPALQAANTQQPQEQARLNAGDDEDQNELERNFALQVTCAT